jgi:hypothetical protein
MKVRKINSSKLRAIGYDARASLRGRIRSMSCSGKSKFYPQLDCFKTLFER